MRRYKVDNIKIISFNDCITEKLKEKGFDGIKGLVTTEEKITYIVKCKNLNQAFKCGNGTNNDKVTRFNFYIIRIHRYLLVIRDKKMISIVL